MSKLTIHVRKWFAARPISQQIFFVWAPPLLYCFYVALQRKGLL
jgi:hypothetical protein